MSRIQRICEVTKVSQIRCGIIGLTRRVHGQPQRNQPRGDTSEDCECTSDRYFTHWQSYTVIYQIGIPESESGDSSLNPVTLAIYPNCRSADRARGRKSSSKYRTRNLLHDPWRGLRENRKQSRWDGRRMRAAAQTEPLALRLNAISLTKRPRSPRFSCTTTSITRRA